MQKMALRARDCFIPNVQANWFIAPYFQDSGTREEFRIRLEITESLDEFPYSVNRDF